MKTTITVFLLVMTALFSNCGSKSGNGNVFNDRPKTPEELRAELKMQEQQDPLQYLKDSNITLEKKRKKIRNGGLFRSAEYADDGGIISGFVKNKATLAKFKDLRVTVAFYSQTKTLIREDAFVIYEYYPPGTTQNLSFKIAEIPSAYDSFNFRITGATPVE